MNLLAIASLSLLSTPSLAPVEYRPAYPVVEAAPSVQHLQDTRFGAGYRFRNMRLNYGGTMMEGWVDNELAGNVQVRDGSWLYGLSAWRFRAPLILSALPADQGHVSSAEVNQISFHAGYSLSWQMLEMAPSLYWSQQHGSSNGQGIAYSGTPWDWTQDRRGIGVALPVIWQLPGPFELTGSVSWLPISDLRLEKAPYSLTNTSFLEYRLGLGIQLTPTLQGELSYTRYWWQGGLNEDSDVFGFGLSYRPERAGD